MVNVQKFVEQIIDLYVLLIPVITYGSDSWPLTKAKDIRVFERKVLREIRVKRRRMKYCLWV